MSATFDISMLWGAIQDIFKELNNKEEKTIEAIKLTRKAFIHTYDYLKNNDGEYIPKIELADLWNDASASVLKVDKQLGDLLANKSRFWTHPDIYFKLGREKEIPELKHITDEMERLRMKL